MAKDEIRLLGRSGGYTKDPKRAVDPREEPEAVSKQDQARITAAAVRNWPHMNALQTATRASRPLGERLARCKRQARHIGADVHGELRLVRLALENGRSAAHVERRIEVLESRLWPER
jgi:hypothetical protein